MTRYDRWSHDGAPSFEENLRIQAGIDATMRDVIANRARPLPSSPTVTVVGAPRVVTAGDPPRGTGWVDPRPLAPPPGQEAIERLVNAVLPHGPKSKAG
jgi:hypothetical protein